MIVAVIPRFVVRKYEAFEAAKKGIPVVVNAAVLSSLLASRIKDWLKIA